MLNYAACSLLYCCRVCCCKLRVALRRYSAPWLLEVMEDACAEAISNAVRMTEASRASAPEAVGGHAQVA